MGLLHDAGQSLVGTRPWPITFRRSPKRPEKLAYYIDYEAMGRDLECSGDVFTIKTGFQEVRVFWNR